MLPKRELCPKRHRSSATRGISRLKFPNHCLCPPSDRKLLYLHKRTSKICPKTGHHKCFSTEQQDRLSERDQVTYDFAMKTFFLFLWSSLPNLRAKSIPKKDNLGFGAKYLLTRLLKHSKSIWSSLRKHLPKSFCTSRNTLLCR